MTHMGSVLITGVLNNVMCVFGREMLTVNGTLNAGMSKQGKRRRALFGRKLVAK